MYTVSLLNLQKPRFGFISLWKEKQYYIITGFLMKINLASEEKLSSIIMSLPASAASNASSTLRHSTSTFSEKPPTILASLTACNDNLFPKQITACP